MNIHYFLIFLILIFTTTTPHVISSKSDVPVGYRLTLAVPAEYTPGFVGRAYLMENAQMEPSFRAALSIEAVDAGKYYSCSLEVFIGEVKVWNSGHYTKFRVSDKCVLELTLAGDLQLKGPNDEIGWRTGTSRQNVERLQIQRTGNLVLVDALNNIKWQSFNFPTDVMLWGQRLDVATRLTSFPTNSNSTSSFYSFEIQPDRVALYLNSGRSKYPYWEFGPSKARNITYVQLGWRGLELLDPRHKKIAQILPPARPSTRPEDDAPRFLALKNDTGNMGLYYYSSKDARFSADFRAVDSTCDLPGPCGPYGICTFANSCSCIRVSTQQPGCKNMLIGEQCSGKISYEMLELDGVSNVLRGPIKRVNISKDECGRFCLDDCTCLAALYDDGRNSNAAGVSECYLYGVVVGIKQVDRGSGSAYMVKVPKGTGSGQGKSGLKKWVLILVGVVDGIIIVAVIGGLVYYLVWKRRKRNTTNTATGDPPTTDNR